LSSSGGYEVVHSSPGLEIGVYVLVAPEPYRQQPHDDDEVYIVLEGTGILEIDFTAAQVLIDLIESCQHDGIMVAVARLESVRAQEAFARFGINDRLGANRVFLSVDQALKALAIEESG